MALLRNWSAQILILSLALPQSAVASPPLHVTLEQAHLQPSLITLDTTGTIEAAELVSVAFQTSGRVAALQVDTGSKVAQGDLLATVDPIQAEAAARAAEAQLSAAEATLTQATSAYDRAKELLDRGATTRANLDTLEQQLMAATAQRDQAQAQLAKARQAISDTMIHAPAAGIITARKAEPGQVIAAGQSIFMLARDGAREAQLYVPDLPGLTQMQGRDITLSTLEGEARSFSAQIIEVSPLVNSATGTIALRATIQADPNSLSLGTPVTTQIQLADRATVSLSAAALVTHQGKPAVWVITPLDQTTGLAEIRPVSLGRYSSDSIEITQGLTEGDWVAGAGAHLLFPGRKVQLPAAREGQTQ